LASVISSESCEPIKCPALNTRDWLACASKRKAYVYIRLNEEKVGISKHRYEELAKEAYAAMTAATKDLGWHEMNCKACKIPSPWRLWIWLPECPGSAN
jgi:hypothetical protein